MRRLEDQRQVSTAAAIEKRGTADTMVGQKSGPALAGPAAPATTALLKWSVASGLIRKYVTFSEIFGLVEVRR